MNKQALCIGINKYPTSNSLPGAVNSANGLTKLLLARGFHVAELLDANATRANILHKVQLAYEACKGMGDLLTILYVGHGDRVSYQGNIVDCLLPVDAFNPDGSLNNNNLILASQWKTLISQRPSHCRVLTIMDCCYGAGDLARAKLSKSQVPQTPETPAWFVDSIPPFTEALGIPVTAANSNLVEFAPCGANQLSVEENFGGSYYSLFTYYLLRAMENKALDNDSYLQLFNYVKSQAMAHYPQATPVISGDSALMAKKFLT